LATARGFQAGMGQRQGHGNISQPRRRPGGRISNKPERRAGGFFGQPGVPRHRAVAQSEPGGTPTGHDISATVATNIIGFFFVFFFFSGRPGRRRWPAGPDPSCLATNTKNSSRTVERGSRTRCSSMPRIQGDMAMIKGDQWRKLGSWDVPLGRRWLGLEGGWWSSWMWETWEGNLQKLRGCFRRPKNPKAFNGKTAVQPSLAAVIGGRRS